MAGSNILVSERRDLMNPHEESSWEIDFRNDQHCLAVDIELLRLALLTALQAEQVASAVLSISLVDNNAIHRLNREHLQHDKHGEPSRALGVGRSSACSHRG